MRIGCFQTDPVCDLFPLMSEGELEDLATDIRRHGLQRPIVLHHGRILDGRNRLLACLQAGAEPRFERWRGSGSPIAWIVSMNLHRRHLDTSQRAIVGARALAVFEAEARARRGRRTDLGAELCGRGKASEQAAALVDVAPRTVEHAKVVLQHGSPELIDAVTRGALSVSAAAVLARRANAGTTRAGAHRPAPPPTSRYDVLAAFPDWNEPAELQRYASLRYDAFAAPGAILFLATPDAALCRGVRLLARCGFEYVSSIVVRRRTGEGSAFVLDRHELVLVGARGGRAPVVADDRRPGSVLEIGDRDRETAVLERIEGMLPGARKAQLCRSGRDGWSTVPEGTAWSVGENRSRAGPPAERSTAGTCG